MKQEREPYARIVVGILTLAILPPMGVAYFGPDDWFINLQNWQSGIGAYWGALFGLGAILMGALYNAELNRARDDRLHEKEARALVSALQAEIMAVVIDITAINTAAVKTYEIKGDVELSSVESRYVLEHQHFEVYEANVKLIGYLDPELTRKTVRFYRLAMNHFLGCAINTVESSASEEGQKYADWLRTMGNELAQDLDVWRQQSTG